VVCCGRPAISQGLLSEAKHLAILNLEHLARAVEQDIPIVGTEPSCISTLLDEYPQLVRTPLAARVAERAFLIETFLRRARDDHAGALSFVRPSGRLLYHAHCHQKALIGSQDALALLQLAYGDAASEINSGCCGMAGAFGHEVEHYEVAKAIGKQRLFAAVRHDPQAAIAVSGFSCRHQIEHHTPRNARHLTEYLADLLSCDG
jgi:Fe-S oxidoreductase